MLFQCLLKQQFPINETHQTVKLCSPTDFAEYLNVLVNHLNRALNKTASKTNTEQLSVQIINEINNFAEAEPVEYF